MKRIFLFGGSAILVLVVVAAVVMSLFNLSALPEPGRAEIWLATRGKHFLVHRASHGPLPAEPTDRASSIQEGNTLFGTECSECHGNSGRKPTDSGRWMYPRAADLTAPEVQRYSDRELFWVVKNGIRLSGMPAFGRVESDEHIWNLVHYVRTLPSQEAPH
ncbi:MAG: cytochrome c [Acidobacteria bacterium]|nr:cytochrome c [Acidobacteriota bacterium]MBS1867922.1 cytochrome c [Acidobacteriota bacterium]